MLHREAALKVYLAYLSRKISLLTPLARLGTWNGLCGQHGQALLSSSMSACGLLRFASSLRLQRLFCHCID